MTFEECFMREWLTNYIMCELYYERVGAISEKEKIEIDQHFEEIMEMFDAYEKARKGIDLDKNNNNPA